MGAHSTLMITRDQAKLFIVDKVMKGLSDKELEDLMDTFLHDRLYNCMIVPDDFKDNDNHVI